MCPGISGVCIMLVVCSPRGRGQLLALPPAPRFDAPALHLGAHIFLFISNSGSPRMGLLVPFVVRGFSFSPPEAWSAAKLCSLFRGRTNKTRALQMAPIAQLVSQSS